MIERVIEASVRHRVFVILVALMIALAGLEAVRTTPVDAIPDLSDVQVIVYTDYSGQSPEVVEDQVTYPLTTAMLSVPHSQTVRGYSFFGFSLVYVIFEDGTDLYEARSRVLEYLSVAQGRLPRQARASLGPDATGVGWVFMYTLIDASPRARVLREKLDADGNGRGDARERPAPQGRSASVEGLAVYTEDQLQALVTVDRPIAGRKPTDFLAESLQHGVRAFDRDGDGALDGALVVTVDPSGAAAAVDLRPGDVVTAAGTAPVTRGGDLSTALASTTPGQQLALTVHRGNGSEIVLITLGS